MVTMGTESVPIASLIALREMPRREPGIASRADEAPDAELSLKFETIKKAKLQDGESSALDESFDLPEDFEIIDNDCEKASEETDTLWKVCVIGHLYMKRERMGLASSDCTMRPPVRNRSQQSSIPHQPPAEQDELGMCFSGYAAGVLISQDFETVDRALLACR